MKKIMKKVGLGLAALGMMPTGAAQAAEVIVRGSYGLDGAQYIFFNHDGGLIDILVRGGGGPATDDTEIFLFENDGSAVGALTGAFVANDDDGAYRAGLGGFFDSYISMPLAEGDYVLSVSQWIFTESEARSGYNFYDRSGFGDNLSGRFSFRATFTSDTPVTIDWMGVPEPSTWMMLLLGFFGIGASLRRSRSQRDEVALVI